LEKDYPYTAKSHKLDCQYEDMPHADVTVPNFTNVEKHSPAAMKQALTIGPLAVSIVANHPSFQAYKSGVFDSSDCGHLHLDHATNVVGWGTDADAGEYWIMRNSWGTSWGEQGYMRMSITEEGTPGICGVQKDALYPDASA